MLAHVLQGPTMFILKNRSRNFGAAMFFTRLLGTLFVVTSTYNASGYSLWHWIHRSWSEQWMLIVPVAFVNVVILVLLVRTTLRSLRLAGIALTVALIGSVVWVLADSGIIAIDSPQKIGVIALYMAGGVLAVGVSWAAAWVRLTGQVSVDDLTSP